MPWGIAVAAVVGAYGANEQAKAGKEGAQAQVDAANAANAESRYQYDTTRNDMMPWLTAGKDALAAQQRFLNGDYGEALNSPFYTATLEEGFKGLDAGASSRGNLFGGGTDADRMRFGQNAASNQLGTYYNALAGLSNTGQTTGNQLGQYGANYAQQYGNNLQTGAQARASSYANSANAWGNYANQVAGMAGNYVSGDMNGTGYFGWGGV